MTGARKHPHRTGLEGGSKEALQPRHLVRTGAAAGHGPGEGGGRAWAGAELGADSCMVAVL
jgi:hypothetical protein